MRAASTHRRSTLRVDVSHQHSSRTGSTRNQPSRRIHLACQPPAGTALGPAVTPRVLLELGGEGGHQGPAVPLSLNRAAEAGEGGRLGCGHAAPGPQSTVGLSAQHRLSQGPWGRRGGSPGCRNLPGADGHVCPPWCPPDPLMGIPPERNHLVDFQGPRPTGASRARLQGAVLHLGQEVLGEGAAHVAAVAVLRGTGSRGWRQVAGPWLGAGGANLAPSLDTRCGADSVPAPDTSLPTQFPQEHRLQWCYLP